MSSDLDEHGSEQPSVITRYSTLAPDAAYASSGEVTSLASFEIFSAAAALRARSETAGTTSPRLKAGRSPPQCCRAPLDALLCREVPKRTNTGRTQPGAPDFHKLRFPGLFPPFLTKEETKQLGSDDFSGPRTSRQWRFVPRRAILLARIKLDDRVCASAPRNRYLRALGRPNHRRRARFILNKTRTGRGRNLVGHTVVLCVHVPPRK